MKVRTVTALAAAAALLTGCSSAPEVACTAIGAEAGIAISIGDPLTDTADSGELEACWGDTCHDVQLELLDPVDGANEDGMTSFAAIKDLAEGEVSVKIALFDAEKVEIFNDETTIETAATYPNGPDCPAGGVQGSVSIQDDKLVANRP